MSTFYYDKFSQLDYYSQWLNYLENNSYIKDVTEAIDKSINEYSAIANIIMDNPQHRAYSLSNETVTESARQNAARIVGYVEQDSNIIRESLFNVGRMLHSCLSIIIDQQRVGQLLKENIALLLQFPDFQRERQYYIEQGFKYYINAAINIDLYKDALENLLQAEIREKTDYIMLHRIGMIYLYAFNVTNPPLAEDYFLRAARYAEMESNPGTERIARILAGNVTSLSSQGANDISMIKSIASESYFQAAFACYVQGKFSEAVNLCDRALNLNPSFAEALLSKAKYLTADGRAEEGAKVLIPLIKASPDYSIIVANDMEFAMHQEIKSMLSRLRDEAIEKLKLKTDSLKSCFSILTGKGGDFDRDIGFLQNKVVENRYLPAISALKLIKEIKKQALDLVEAIEEYKKVKEALLIDSYAQQIFKYVELLANSYTYSNAADIKNEINKVRDWNDVIYKEPSGKLIYCFCGQKHNEREVIESLAFSPDNTILATASQCEYYKVYDLKTWDGSFIREGLLTPESHCSMLKIWSIKNGNELLSVNENEDLHCNKRVMFIPHSNTLISLFGSSLKLWNINENGRITSTGQLEDVYDFVITEDESIIVFLSPVYGIFKIVELKNGKELQTFKGIDCKSLTISPNGQILAIGGKGNIVLWDIKEKRKITTLFIGSNDNSKEVRKLQFSSNGKNLVAAVGHGGIEIWDLINYRNIHLHSYDTNTYNRSFALSPCGQLLAVDNLSLINIYEIESGRLVFTIDINNYKKYIWNLCDNNDSFSINSISFSCDGKILAVGGSSNGHYKRSFIVLFEINLSSLKYYVMNEKNNRIRKEECFKNENSKRCIQEDKRTQEEERRKSIAKSFFEEAQIEEKMQNEKWLFKDYTKAIQLYKKAKELGYLQAEYYINQLQNRK